MLGAAFLLTLVAVAGAAARPEVARACSGSVLVYEDAIRLSDGAIYAGRVTGVEPAGEAWIDLTIDVDLVVRGPASRHVPRAQAGVACNGIVEGQWGYVVRGVHDAQRSATNLFFRISTSAAREALHSAGLPDTSTATRSAREPSDTWHGALLAIAVVAGFGFSAQWLGYRRRSRALVISGDIPQR